MSKFPWNNENKRLAHNELLKKVNKVPVVLDKLDSIEYGDDGVARFTNSQKKVFEHNMLEVPKEVKPKQTEVKKALVKKETVKKSTKKAVVKK